MLKLHGISTSLASQTNLNETVSIDVDYKGEQSIVT